MSHDMTPQEFVHEVSTLMLLDSLKKQMMNPEYEYIDPRDGEFQTPSSSAKQEVINLLEREFHRRLTPEMRASMEQVRVKLEAHMNDQDQTT